MEDKVMDSRNSEEKEHTAFSDIPFPVQSPVSLDSIVDLFCTDPSTGIQSDYSKFDVPGDGSCLFWAVTLAYLIPVKDDDDSFQLRYKDLVGSDETAVTKLSCVRTSIQNYNPLSNNVPQDGILAHLVKNTFRNRVVDFIESNLDRFKCFSEISDAQYRSNMRNPDIWCGDAEIQAISLILNCKINVGGQIFPLFSSTEKTNHNSKNVTLELFHVNRSTGDTEAANHFNYGLEERLIKAIRETQMNTTQVFEMDPIREIETFMQEYDAEHDHYGNEPLKNLKESDISITSVFSLSDGLENELLSEISNELECETLDKWEEGKHDVLMEDKQD